MSSPAKTAPRTTVVERQQSPFQTRVIKINTPPICHKPAVVEAFFAASRHDAESRKKSA